MGNLLVNTLPLYSYKLTQQGNGTTAMEIPKMALNASM